MAFGRLSQNTCNYCFCNEVNYDHFICGDSFGGGSVGHDSVHVDIREQSCTKKTQEAKMGECISDMRLGVTSIVACGLYLFFLDLNESTYLLPLQLRDVLEGCWGVCYVF